MAPHTLSPSRIARYFYHDCERYLRYHATPRALRAGWGVPDPRARPSPFTAAILAHGYEWEEAVVRERLNGSARVAPGTGALHERAHGVEETLALLHGARPGDYLYQPTLEAPEAFLARYGLDPARCRFLPCRPDLLQLIEDGRGWRLRVIDIKASHGLKTSHRIQIARYGLLLRDALADCSARRSPGDGGRGVDGAGSGWGEEVQLDDGIRRSSHRRVLSSELGGHPARARLQQRPAPDHQPPGLDHRLHSPAVAEHDGEIEPVLALPVGAIVLGQKIRRALAVRMRVQNQLVLAIRRQRRAAGGWSSVSAANRAGSRGSRNTGGRRRSSHDVFLPEL